MKIKAVIFDVGGVLIRTEDHSHRRKLEQELGLTPGESELLVFDSEAGQKSQRGEITDDEKWHWIARKLNLDSAGLRHFQKMFWAGDKLDTTLVNYIRSLRPRYQTAIISNAPDNLRYILTKHYPILDAFDLVVCSAEEKVMKPNPLIYQRTLVRLGRQPEETVFIDDSLPNVQAARALGIHAVHFRPGIHVPDELEKLGIVTQKVTKG
ncbi:MAG: HAD family phosphatase [Chloroflexi bacterium]|nr:MAG: HAD family phosphatase [Chloroflexota bacterium]